MICTTTKAQNHVEYFSLNENSAGIQFFGISTDKRGLTYFAHNQGILEFDGVEWRKISMSQDFPIRAIDELDGRIFGGGNNTFGYLFVDKSGLTQFQNIADELEDPLDETIIDIEVIGEDVYFIGLRSIYVFRQNVVQKLDVSGEFTAAGTLNGNLVVSDEKRGILILVDSHLKELLGGEALRARHFASVGKKKLILSTPSQRLFEIATMKNGYSISPFSTYLSAYENEMAISGIVNVKDTLIAVGTYSSGVFFLSPNGDFISSVNAQSGLFSNDIYAMLVTRDNKLWLAQHKMATLIDLSQLFPDLPLEVSARSKRVIDLSSNDIVEDSHEEESSKYYRVLSKYYETINSWVASFYETRVDSVAEASNEDVHTFSSIIRKVEQLPTDSVIFWGAFTQSEKGIQELTQADTLTFIFPFEVNAFRFSFATNTFEKLQNLEYQVKLDGLDRTWSAWSGNTFREYTNLGWGDYNFRVRARNYKQEISDEGSFSFTIEPPWYEATWFYFSQFSFLLGCVLVSSLLNRRGYALSLSEALIAMVVIVCFQYLELFASPYLDAYSNDIAVFNILISVTFGFSLGYVQDGFQFVLARMTGLKKTASVPEKLSITNN